MLRIICLNILPGMLLTACVIGFCSVTASAQNVVTSESKQMYSNRAIGFTVPTPYYGTPAMPVFLNPPVMTLPAVPVRVQAAQTVRADVDASSTLAPPTPAPVAVAPSEPQISNVMAPSAPVPPVLYSVPKINTDDELDTLYARLAKIQLEKHQLDDALTLVKSIKSEVFRVRTLVDLAEYVSRDKNYQSEAEKLFSLALSSMEALDK